jgi:penicillin-insensitive murein DD-endopeptidase
VRLLASALASALALLSGCVELGVIGDGTSISMGRPNQGYIVDGVRLPDRGDGFFTREKWRERGNRYGTDELVDLITAVSRRMVAQGAPRMVVADLSAPGGGAALKWHRSHQTGRDVDLLFYVRDRDGKPVEADDMRVFDGHGRARDGSGYKFDVSRNWQLVRELLVAREALVQWVFVAQPLANRMIEHAQAIGEPEVVLAKARLALRQPARSSPHDEHFHVRIYCAAADRPYGCVDVGPMEMLALHEADLATDVIAAMPGAPAGAPTAASAAAVVGTTLPSASASTSELQSLGRLIRSSIERIPLGTPRASR